MNRALKKVLKFLKLYDASSVELLGNKQHPNMEESKFASNIISHKKKLKDGDEYRKIEETEVMLKFAKYTETRKTEKREDLLRTHFKVDQTSVDYNTDKTQLKFKLINAETNTVSPAFVKYKQTGILQFGIETGNDLLNNFPSLGSIAFSGVKLSPDYLEVFISNKLDEQNYIQKAIIGENLVYDEVSLRIYYDPFAIDFLIYPSADYETKTLEKVKDPFKAYKYLTMRLVTIDTITSVETIHYKSLSCWGLGERMSDFKLKDNQYRLFNLDRGGHIPGGVEALYGSYPLLYNEHDFDNKKLVTSFMVENPSEGIVDLETIKENFTNKLHNIQNAISPESRRVLWRFDSCKLSCYFYADLPERIYYKNAKITGFAYLPPLFSLGFHQCRWGYDGISDALKTEIGFDDHEIPLDVFWFDIDHTDKKHYFTWDPVTFPIDQVKNLITLLANNKRKLVTIIDPHLSIDKDFEVGQTLLNNKCVVLNNDEKKTPFIGKCWPGDCYYGDFLNPKCVELYKKQFYKNENYFVNADNMFTWVDMNEPSVFDVIDKTFAYDALHWNGEKFILHRDVHNIYGQLYNKTAFESLQERYPNTRPFVLTRSSYLGSQQFGFHWTGDNTARWEHVKYSLQMIMTHNALGMNNVGADVGGFIGDPSEELLCYWHEVGVFYPFFRAHSDIQTKRREPWKLSKESLARIRDAVYLRYNLIFFFYTQAYICNQTALPHITPYLTSDHLYSYGNQFVISIKNDEDKDDLPTLLSKTNQLYNFRTGAPVTSVNELNVLAKPESKLDIFVKGGTIIPWAEKATISSEYTVKNPISLMIFPDEDGNASGFLYQDDGKTYDYKNNDDYLLVHYTLKNFTNLTTEIIHKPLNISDKIFDYNSQPYYKNFLENIYLFGHKQASSVSSVSLLLDGFTQPLESVFEYNEETNLLLTMEIMVNITEGFTMSFN